MRVVRWKNAATGVQSLTITEAGIYFPVGKEDGSFIGRYVMASAGQSASVEIVRDSNGTRVGVPGVSVSGTTETISRYKRSLAFGIIVTAISGTLIATLDDQIVRTIWPDNLGRFPAQADLDAYTYMGTGLDGCTAMVAGVQMVWNGTGWVLSSGVRRTPVSRAPFKPTQLDGAGATGSLAASTTYSQVMELMPGMSGVIVVLQNPLTSALPILGAKFTTIDSIAGSIATTGQNLTVGGSPVTSIPAADSANGNAGCPGLLVCDPIYFTPVARTDGGTSPLGMLKIAFNAISAKYNYVATGDNAMVKYGAWGSLAGNQLNGAFSASHTTEMYIFAEFICFGTTPKISVCTIGDSLASGASQVASVGGGLIKACGDLGLPLANWAKGGAGSSARDATVSRLIEAGIHQHSITFMQAWSQNSDGVSIAGVDATFGKGLILFDKMQNSGMNPVILTPAPLNSAPSVVMYLYNKIKASGLPYFDMMVPLSDGTGAYKPEYSIDGIHPDTAAGVNALRDAYITYLRAMMA